MSSSGNNTNFEIFDDVTSHLSPAGLQWHNEVEQYQNHIANAILPAITIVPVNNVAYAEHNSRLPLNIFFQVRIKNTAHVRQTYPTAAAGQMVRLYYPDYQSYQRLVHDGFIRTLGIPSEEVIVRIKIVAKQRLNNIIIKELNPNKEDWDNAMTELREEDIGGKVGEGLGSSHCVKLFVTLA